MAVDAIGRIDSQTFDISQSSVGLEDFLQIFLTQLSFQDPLEPVDNREFIAQLAQFSSLQVASETEAGIDSMLDLQSANQSIGLIGREVEVSSPEGNFTGEVISIRFQGATPLLTVKQNNDLFVTDISPSRITLVK